MARVKITYSSDVRDVIKGTDKIERAQDDLAKNAKRTARTSSDALDSIARAASSAATAMVALGAASAAAIGAASLKQGADFERAMAGVAAKTGASTEELEALEAKAREMGRATLFSATEAAGGLEELGKAGLKTGQAMEALDAALLLAGSSGREIDETSTLLVATMSQFGLAASDAARISDVFSTAMRTSLLDAESLTNAMRFAGTAGSSFGMSLEETTSAVAAFRNIGLEGAQAGTSFRMAMISAANGTQLSEAALRKYGKTQEDINPEVHSFAEIMQLVADTGMSASDTIRIFGSRAGANVARIGAALREGSIDINEFTSALEQSAGSTEQSYGRMLDTVAAKTQIVGSAAQDLMIELFQGYSEPLSRLLDEIPLLLQSISDEIGINKKEIQDLADDALGSVGEWLRDEGPEMARVFAESTKAAVKFAGALSKVLPYLDEIGILVGSAFAAAKVYQFTQTVQAATVAIRAFGVSGVAAMGPIGAAIAATAAAGAGLLLIMKKMEKATSKREQRAMASGERRLKMIDREMEAEIEIRKGLELKQLLQKELTEEQAATLAATHEKIQALAEERFAQQETLRVQEEQKQSLKDQLAAAKELADQLSGASADMPTIGQAPAEDTPDPMDAVRAQERAQAELDKIAQQASDQLLSRMDLVRAERDRQLDQLRLLAMLSGDRATAEVAMADVELQAEKEIAEIRAEITEQRMEEIARIREAERAAHDERMEEISSSINSAISAAQIVSDSFKTIASVEYDYRKSTADKLQAYLDNNRENLTQAEKDALKVRIRDARQATKKVAKIQRALAIFQIGIDTASGVMKVWSEFGAWPPVAAALSAGVIAQGVASGVAVSREQLEFARGGIRPEPTVSADHIETFVAPGEAVLNRSTTARLGPDMVNDLNSGGGPQTMGSPLAVYSVYKHKVYDPFVQDSLAVGGSLDDAIRSAGRTPGHSRRPM